jgi:transcriptional regulator with XRE-family HTH domain
MARMKKPFPAAAEFGKRVRSAREDLSWSQENLAEASGLHWTYVSSVERGERNISLLNILKVAEALGTDPATLVGALRPPKH